MWLQYPQESRLESTENSIGRFFLGPEYQLKDGDYRLQITGQAYYENPDHQLYDFKELYFNTRPGTWTMSVGHQIFNWSTFDLVPDFNYLNPQARLSPLVQTQLGAAALHIKYSQGPSTMEAVFIPIQRKPVLPHSSSRWWPRDVTDLKESLLKDREDLSEVRTPNAPTYQILGFEELDDALCLALKE